MDTDVSRYIKASQVKVGDIILIQGHPCKVIEVSKSKTGKHGSSKVFFAFEGGTHDITLANIDVEIKI